MRTQTATRQEDIVSVMAAHGIALAGAGPEFKGRCPFHDDETPSLSVNRDKGVFHCFGCGAKGNLKVFEARMNGRLATGRDFPPNAAIPGGGGTASTSGAVIEKRFEPVGNKSGEDAAAVIERMVGLYQEALAKNQAALAYLAGRGLGDADLLRRYRVGYSGGALRRFAPPRGATWNALRAAGYVNERGYEHFAGCVVWPITNEAGAVVGMYGRRVVSRQGAPKHLYLPGPHRGIWNREGAKAAVENGAAVILCESVIDAHSCAAAGMPGAVALYGTNGMTREHADFLAELRPGLVVVMLDGDDAGREGTRRVIERLDASRTGETPLGFNGAARRLAVANLPEGRDANEVLVKEGMDALRRFADQATPLERPAALAESAPSITSRSPALTVDQAGDLSFTSGERTYHVKNFNAFGGVGMRATLLLAIREPGAAGAGDSPVHIDTLDLYSRRSRSAFISDAFQRLNLEAAAIEADLLNLVLALDDHRRRTAEKLHGKDRQAAHVMTPEETALGLAFLTGPDLVAEIIRDCEAVGYVGEEDNKTLGYLIATSRKMREPLSAILVASSGAGKSALMDILEELMPPEDVYAVSDLTDNALFYMTPDELAHKLLIIAERSGSQDADYSLRELQTKRVLRKGVAIKDPETGKIRTVRIEVRGPVAVMESTTNPRMNPENANRCFVLHVDESRAQTEAIQRAQRCAKSRSGLERDAERAAAIARHRAAQRLLEPLRVVIPFAERIKFPADTVRTRRDHARFLNLIEAVAFLHQKKRQVKTTNDARYIEATFEDYDLACRLALDVLTANLDELPRASRALLDAMEKRADAKAPGRRETVVFTRRELVETTGWTYDQIRGAMWPLLDRDMVFMERGSRGMALYRLGAVVERPLIELSTSAEISRATP